MRRVNWLALLSGLTALLVVGAGGALMVRHSRELAATQKLLDMAAAQESLVKLHAILEQLVTEEHQRKLEKEIPRWPETGIGFLLKPDFIELDGHAFVVLRVNRVFKNTDAYRAGIRPGQLLLRINGISAVHLSGDGESPQEAAIGAIALMSAIARAVRETPVSTVTTIGVNATPLRRMVFGTGVGDFLQRQGSAWVKDIAESRRKLARISFELQGVPDEAALSRNSEELSRIYGMLGMRTNAFTEVLEDESVSLDEPTVIPDTPPLS